jgi:predicted enzyme related to lactoylglutathione lyase
MPRPVHFEIPSDNPQRAIDFYSTVFGWKFTKWAGPMDYWLITTGTAPEPGIDGGLMQRRDPNQPCVNTITVTNLDESIAAVQANGGGIALGKMPVPGVGWLAYCKDTDGHIFGMMQPDTSAK